MKPGKMLATMGMLLGASILGAGTAAAAAPAARGEERAIERLQRAASEHVRILTELQARLPEEARADLATAIEAAGKGLEQAQSVHLSGGAEPAVAEERKPPRNEGNAGKPEETPGTSGAPDDTPGDSPDHATGLVHAREQMAAAFEKSIQTLTEVMGRVPEQAAARIQTAITRIQENHARALANMDRVMAREHPQRAERPDRPSRPERAERPQRPERAERPARPERPRP